MIKILITNAENKNTLSAIRNIDGDCEITVIKSSKFPVLCSFSRYCDKSIYIPSNNEDSALKYLIIYLQRYKYDILIPVGLDYCTLISNHADEIKKYVKVMVPEWGMFRIAAEKNLTMNFAKENEVSIPETISIYSIQDLNLISSYPCVMKSSTGTGEFVYYCHSLKEVQDKYVNLTNSEKEGVICQEYVDSFGCGYFGLYDKGKPLAEFMHKRIKEYPVSGGPSVVAESFCDEKLKKYGQILCHTLNWTGPIMCEFKYDTKSDDYKLIEINPKLWGSLDLTISAGVNIPELMVKYMIDGDKASGLNPQYKYVRFRWVIPGEFLHLIDTYPKTKLSDFLRVHSDEKINIVLKDPYPTLYQLLLTFIKASFKIFGARCLR